MLGFSCSNVSSLQQEGFSVGLIRALENSVVPLRVWLVDNSTSMSIRDAPNGNQSRWDEVRSSVVYQANLAGNFGMPTRFTMLNKTDQFLPQAFSIAERKNGSSVQQEIQLLDRTLKSSFPSGATPISKHLVHIRDAVVRPRASDLKRKGQQIAIVIATDGLPSNECDEGHVQKEEFVQVLRSLSSLPVWIVIRLCTDDRSVFQFYNSLDAIVDLPLDVLDDFEGEALEVYLHNPWLTYAMPLHRVREMGFPHAALDFLDERALSLAELHSLCFLLFAKSLPDPARDWTTFLKALSGVMNQEKRQWNSVTKSLSPWIDLGRLHTAYGKGIQFPLNSAASGAPPGPCPNAQMRQLFPSTNVPPFQQTQHFGLNANTAHKPVRPRWQSTPAAQVTQRNPPVVSSQRSRAQSVPAIYSHSAPRPAPVQQPRAFQRPQKQPNYHQQQQQLRQQPPPPQRQHVPPPSSTHQNTAKYVPQTPAGPNGDKTYMIKYGILRYWALRPPDYQHLRPIDALLATVQTSFPPAHGVAPHDYFQKFKPFAPDALASRDSAVLKRAVRDMRIFLHPDRLPRDFSSEHSFVCRLLWDITSDAWEQFQK